MARRFWIFLGYRTIVSNNGWLLTNYEYGFDSKGVYYTSNVYNGKPLMLY